MSTCTTISWNNELIKKEPEKFVFGIAADEEVVFDLSSNSHILIHGSPMSGKSILASCLAWQGIKKGVRLYMADLKGVEFCSYKEYGEVLTDKGSVAAALAQLHEETELRIELFKKYGVESLEEFNNKYPQNQLSRIMFVCDEMLELKDNEENNAKIKEYIESIAFLTTSRRINPGIHLVLISMRSDYKVISQQLRACVSIKISGKMYNPYDSELAIGDTKATELNHTGQFVYVAESKTKEFQGFNFDVSYMEPGKYQRGLMLTGLVVDPENDYIPISEILTNKFKED